MKNRRRLLAWILTVAMTVPVVPVYAVESADNEAVVIEEVTATEEVESVEESQVETESVLEDEMLSETVVTVEDTSEVATTEEETTEIQTETTTEEETTEAKIEELDSSFKLDDKDKKLKAEMAGSMGQLDSAVPGIDYVANEVYLLTDSQTEAEAVAEAFGGTIKKFNCGVATVTLPDDISVAEAVAFGADEDTNMFAVMPNFYARLYDDYEDEYSEVLGTTIEETEENGDIDILEVFETEIEEEELELEGNVDAAYTDPYLHNGSDKYQYQHNSLGSVYAWKAGYTGKNIKVAVIDSGVKPITLDGKTELPVEYSKSCYSGSTSALDENDHGTHVAGIIAARLNGVAGAGIAPEALIYNIRVGDADGSITYADEYAGLREAIDKNVDVVNMSLGGI